MLDDSPSFTLQRRNLMGLSSIVLFAYLFHINFPFIEQIGLGQFQLSITLLIVTGYFLLRFYQTIEKQEKGRLYESFNSNMDRIVRTKIWKDALETVEEQLQQYLKNHALQPVDYKRLAKDRWELQEVSSRYGSNVVAYKFVWALTGEQLQGHTFQGSRDFVYFYDSSEYKKMKKKALADALIHNELFTEYVLPYILAISSVFTLVYHIFSHYENELSDDAIIIGTFVSCLPFLYFPVNSYKRRRLIYPELQ